MAHSRIRRAEGEDSSMIMLFYLLMFATLLVIGIKYVRSVAGGSQLERTFLARDSALTISVMQAAPGIITYHHPFNLSKSKLTLTVQNFSTNVSDEFGFNSLFFFPETRGLNVEDMLFTERISLKKNSTDVSKE